MSNGTSRGCGVPSFVQRKREPCGEPRQILSRGGLRIEEREKRSRRSSPWPGVLIIRGRRRKVRLVTVLATGLLNSGAVGSAPGKPCANPEVSGWATADKYVGSVNRLRAPSCVRKRIVCGA